MDTKLFINRAADLVKEYIAEGGSIHRQRAATDQHSHLGHGDC